LGHDGGSDSTDLIPEDGGSLTDSPRSDATSLDLPPSDAPSDGAGSDAGGCESGDAVGCPEGEYCLTDGCGPALVGICIARPSGCSDRGEPVCACDGITYANDCEAQMAGQLAIGPAPCPAEELECEVDTSGFGFGSGCGVNEYCFGGCDGQGFCKERPRCGEGPMQVQCACNGRDYGNPCLLASSGRNLDYPGWCAGEPPTTGDENCAGVEEVSCSDETMYCDVQSCEPLATGICVGIWVPGESAGELCLPSSPKQCGCDDHTYLNKCARVLAGVAFQHLGECGAGTCTLGEAGQCGTGLYCNATVGLCEGEGECAEASLLCGLIPGAPAVCGCDDSTYDSLCHARQADVPVRHWGACSE
jgi:hypothetical protein